VTVEGTSAQVVEACGRIAGKAQPFLQLKIYFLNLLDSNLSLVIFMIFSELLESRGGVRSATTKGEKEGGGGRVDGRRECIFLPSLSTCIGAGGGYGVGRPGEGDGELIGGSAAAEGRGEDLSSLLKKGRK
jgi:hypothetical protein